MGETPMPRKKGITMSCVIVVTPLVIAGWPVISAAVTAAVASMGFNIVQSGAALTNPNIAAREEPQKARVEVDVEESEILQGAIENQQIVVEKSGMRAVFSREARGQLKLCMEGEGYS